jgi:hypothetical protein
MLNAVKLIVVAPSSPAKQTEEKQLKELTQTIPIFEEE